MDKLQMTVSRKTRRVSCQFPLVWGVDMTPQHPANVMNNSWTLIQVKMTLFRLWL
jgi:hypothetical protein